MSPAKHLIVNADDFGLSLGVNRGIIKAHEQGIVTSASLMVRWPAAAEAAAYARVHPKLSVGLHVDLGEWTFVNETWRAVYEVVPVENAGAIADEITRQLDCFRRLMGHNPTHLDSHQHVHRTEPVRSIMMSKARTMRIVLRGHAPEVGYCGQFYGQSSKGGAYPEGITVQTLLKILQDLSPGTTELGCHPGQEADVNSSYLTERAVECQTLCDPRVRAALAEHDIMLCSFSDRPGHGKARRIR